jgi:hypothetical protein
MKEYEYTDREKVFPEKVKEYTSKSPTTKTYKIIKILENQ